LQPAISSSTADLVLPFSVTDSLIRLTMSRSLCVCWPRWYTRYTYRVCTVSPQLTSENNSQTFQD